LKEATKLKSRLDNIVIKMKKVTGDISADGQPATARELDKLTSLGTEYGEIVSQLAAIKTDGKSTA
jgi:hypothetical protein